ncbi:hypothetical protein LTR64_006095 [Lithohypha guttulata]|uniref:uncharacterized protein n=1 Tax=Lithohypha guttulata TaxID=1690604 RepID=UPI002DDF791B|nr:hypothetical protein LTR51_002107 [Lithohypha guttulata]
MAHRSDTENREIEVLQHDQTVEVVQPHDPFLSSTSTINSTATLFPRAEDFTNAFTFEQTTSNATRTPFQFQQRARDAAASTQITNRISAGRTSRTSGFLDRLRRTRRDERDSRGIESFEKADYWRERREREARLRREAQQQDGPLSDIVEKMDIEQIDDLEDAELSPVDEDQEVEELVHAYFDRGQQLRGENDQMFAERIDQQDDNFEIDDDSAYEEVFMEVLSQEHRPRFAEHTGHVNMAHGPSEQSNGGEMDIS